MKKLYLARHGQNVDNAKHILNGHRDEPLTELGIKQALDLAEHLHDAGLHFDHVLSSPLQRAYVTACLVSNTVSTGAVTVMNLLIERDFGIMTGKHASEIEKLCAPDVLYGEKVIYFLSPEGAETFDDLMKRANEILVHILGDTTLDGHILMMCHGDIGKMLYAAYYSVPWREILTDFHFGNCELLLLDHDSDPGERHVLKFEQFNH